MIFPWKKKRLINLWRSRIVRSVATTLPWIMGFNWSILLIATTWGNQHCLCHTDVFLSLYYLKSWIIVKFVDKVVPRHVLSTFHESSFPLWFLMTIRVKQNLQEKSFSITTPHGLTKTSLKTSLQFWDSSKSSQMRHPKMLGHTWSIAGKTMHIVYVPQASTLRIERTRPLGPWLPQNIKANQRGVMANSEGHNSNGRG